MAPGHDPYARTAPFYDVMASSLWATLGPALAGLLVDVGGLDHPIGPDERASASRSHGCIDASDQRAGADAVSFVNGAREADRVRARLVTT